MLVQLAKASLTAFRSQCHFNSILVLKSMPLILKKENGVKIGFFIEYYLIIGSELCLLRFAKENYSLSFRSVFNDSVTS